ncbi:hypothetical protein BDW59DRAFT_136275 [Aspergillus cavernicola]|uniref:Uncharacterized protein n=1 Tax=Aspergillus cavernicola TaxID=176166 RepID=A0ABR4HNQ4_9EURO
MSFSRTPLRAPPRHNARSQFASTPRFLLSQRASQHKESEESDSILPDVDPSPSSFPRSRPTPTAGRGPTPHRKEVIEDSESEPDQEQGLHQRAADGVALGDISSPPPDTTELDAELEALFGPTRRRAKKRRVSLDMSTPGTRKRKLHDWIESSSPEPSYSTAAGPPSPSLPYRTTPQRTPRPQPPTPVTGKPSTLQRRKPYFVLPRSPSPEKTDEPNAIPTPFSPSSHALRRRGRARSSGPTYLPGGMAAEVRSWILEIGTKREQHLQAALHHGNQTEPCSVNHQRYSFMICINTVRQSALGSCGPLVFIQGQAIVSPEYGGSESADGGISLESAKNVLLLGAPRLRPGELRTSTTRVPGLQTGDVVGICRGLAWEVGVDDQGNNMRPAFEHEHILRRESERSPGLGRWLVGMEWEMISLA